MRCRRFPGRPVRIEPVAVREVDVQPSVMVVVEKGQSAALGLNDDPLVVDSAPHVGDGQAGLLRDIDKLDWRGCGIGHGGLLEGRIFPFPEWSCKSVREGTAEHEERRAEETTTRKIHGLR